MIRWSNRILFGMNALLLGGFVLFIAFRGVSPVHDGIEYKDLIAIILSAVAVLLAAVTIFVAVVAIWGYNSIREESINAAVKAARDVAQTTASREALAVLKFSSEAGQPDEEDELAAALKSGGRKGAATQPKRDPGKARPVRTGKTGGAG
jgi:hypothetical protein